MTTDISNHLPKAAKKKPSRPKHRTSRTPRNISATSRKGLLRKNWYVKYIIIVVCVLVAWLFFAGGKEWIGLTIYLNNKYEKPFVVEYPKIANAGFGVPGSWNATARSLNDWDTPFVVTKSTTSDHYNDNYAGALWTKEEQVSTNAFLKRVYGYGTIPNYDLKINLSTPSSPFQGVVPNFTEAKSQYGDKIMYDLTIKVSGEFNEKTLAEHFPKWKQAALYVKGKDVGRPYLTYVINLESEDARKVCTVNFENFALSESSFRDCFGTIKYQGRV